MLACIISRKRKYFLKESLLVPMKGKKWTEFLKILLFKSSSLQIYLFFMPTVWDLLGYLLFLTWSYCTLTGTSRALFEE